MRSRPSDWCGTSAPAGATRVAPGRSRRHVAIHPRDVPPIPDLRTSISHPSPPLADDFW